MRALPPFSRSLLKSFLRVLTLLVAGLCTSPFTLHAEDADVLALKKQMQELQAALQTMQAEHQKQIEALTTQVQSQQKLIETLQKAPAVPVVPGTSSLPLPKPSDTPAAGTLFPTTDDSVVTPAGGGPAPGAAVTSAPAPAAGGVAFPTTDDSVVASTPGEAPSPAAGGSMISPLAPAPGAPITLMGGGKSFMNISFNGQFSGAVSSSTHLSSLEVSDHDPQQTGFNARNLEIALDGAVDPYFEGFVNLVFKLDNHGETEVEAEEAYMQTTDLPYGLQVRAGQFFSPFGRINAQHPHVWDFVDAPLASGRLMGSDGLRGIGAQISWVTPLPWYSQFVLAMQNGEGNTGYSFRNNGDNNLFMGRETIDRNLQSVQDLVLVPRWENSFDLSPSQTVLAGVSGAFGPNDTGYNTRTQAYAADLFYKWKPANAEGGWPFVKWQTEAIYRRYQAGRGMDDSFPVAEKFSDWGMYSQVVWGFTKGWDWGVRGDYLHMQNSAYNEDPDRQSRRRVSSALTWHLTEFSKLRLQYNHDFLSATPFLPSGQADSVFLQFEFNLGSHGAHKF